MNKQKYRIIVDTNVVYHSSDGISRIFNLGLLELPKFIKEHNLKDVRLCFPEIVIGERVTQCSERATNSLKTLTDKLREFEKIGLKCPKPFDKVDFITIFEDQAKSFVKENDITLIKTPTIDQEGIIKRLLKREPPFRDEDRGFKDTLIWLSIIEDAKTEKDCNYIVLSNNSTDFSEEKLRPQFEAISKKELKILSKIEEVKEYLDKELNLKLHLKERYKHIEQIIFQKHDKIMLEINKNRYYIQQYSSSLALKYVRVSKIELLQADIDFINEAGKSQFTVQLTVKAYGEILKSDISEAGLNFDSLQYRYLGFRGPITFSQYENNSFSLPIEFKVTCDYEDSTEEIIVRSIELLSPEVKEKPSFKATCFQADYSPLSLSGYMAETQYRNPY